MNIPLETANLTNASSSVTNGFANSMDLFPVVIVVGLITLAVFVGTSVSRIEWFHDKLKAFSQSLYYTIIGVASTVIAGVVFSPLYYLSRADGETQALVGYAVGGLVVAYIVFTGLGYVVDRYILTNVRTYLDEQDITFEPSGEGDG